eukprot:m.247959 g.247959  ORF g.247959 m.247959 type:complete len:329 (+) comp15584_c0_seq1:25-1011(+)
MANPSFGFAFDIDGVLYTHTAGLGYELIPGAKEVFELLDSHKVPYVFLSNSTGKTESERAEVLSDLLGMKIPGEKLVLSSTPFRELVPEFGSKRVLSVALTEENGERLAREHGFSNFTTIQSYAKRHPHLFPCKPYDETSHNPADEPAIEAIFVFEVPMDWGEAVQILVDLLRSSGRPGREHEAPTQPVPIFSCCPDFHFGASHSLPRLTNGAFLLALRAIFAEATGRQLNVNLFGKPHPSVYASAHRILAAEHGAALGRIFMVGDNPKSDIHGAIAAGEPWYPILVRTGCFQGGDNDPHYPARFVAKNALEAVQHGLQTQGINLNAA